MSSQGRNASEQAFVVSAPGKVIVFGEHAVVHGKAAIAAAISLRSYLLVIPSTDNEKTITLKFPDVGLDHSWAVDELPWSSFSAPSKAKTHTDRVTELDSDLVAAIKPHVEVVSPNLHEQVRGIHRHAASAFLYILLSLAKSDIVPCTYVLRSTIPIAAGLGSSASISVCISAVVLRQMGYLQLPTPDQNHDSTEHILETINQWAFVGEICIHGTPSGVDNTVATRGKAVLFKRTTPGKPPLVNPLHEFPVLPLLLVNTKQSRSTATEVAKVGALRKSHPIVCNLLLDSIDKITESAHILISQEFDAHNPGTLLQLGELVRMNHGLLVSLGVSHPKLERIREIVDHAGIGWTKLTGAGGGGCAITILKDQPSASVLHELENRLESEGFAKYETLLGGNGVGILDPAILQGDNNHITEEVFLQAKDNEALESLVGPGTEEHNRGWKYWGR